MGLNHAQRIANKLRNAERYGPAGRLCNKYFVNPHRTMRHLASVGPGPPRECTYTHTHCTLHYTLGCMHCELNVTGPSPSDGGEVGGGVVVVVGMV